ncbi:MAG TPA: O-methyltransferase, partial [Lachnospiraceae bacterium]|nr:O-methyltransferase [Lachnospiraceae bacterium]
AKGQYLNFLPFVLEMLSEDGMFVTDNVLQDGDVIQSRYAITRRDRTIHGRMREYLYRLTHMENLDTVILPVGDGVTLSVWKEERN